MPRHEPRWSGWQGISLVTITYVYFLIFAQFAFLKRLAALGVADTHLKAVMAAMAAGGILLSLLAPRLALLPRPGTRLQVALSACAASAALSLLPLNLPGSLAVALLIGCGLGLLTVTLVTHLRGWLGTRNPLLGVGLGTGLGYFLCNFPPLFTASLASQAITAAALCVAGIFISASQVAPVQAEAPHPRGAFSFPRALISFTALVWLDSAAFFIIQNTPALKAGTWQGSAHLWGNGLLHLLAALGSVWLLRRRGTQFVLALAFLSLAAACLLLLHPDRVLLASFLYPVGVSLYSVALVAYPSLLGSAALPAERGRQAGWIYTVAGWVGSAMGIGMGQHLGHVPPAFVALAGVPILLPLLYVFFRSHSREVAATAAVLAAAFCIRYTIRAMQQGHPPLSQAERGRQVYIAEGCIHCHSQYVRPRSADALMWGPAESLEDLRRQRPPLIGNRRQGPDLSEVGSRRSPLWFKAHFYAPPMLSYASFMPSYAYLFRDRRGGDLVAYLESLRAADYNKHLLAEAAWNPSPLALQQSSVTRGASLYPRYCATCHDAQGAARLAWRTSFNRLPPDLLRGTYPDLSLPGSAAQRSLRLAQVVKFGLPGTDMPGHEYLSDRDAASLGLWLSRIGTPAAQQTNSAIGDTK